MVADDATHCLHSDKKKQLLSAVPPRWPGVAIETPFLRESLFFIN